MRLLNNKKFMVNIQHLPPPPSPTYNLIDLGLPSGTLWADRNIGASSIYDYGLYFAWGETNGYSLNSQHNFAWSDYSHCEGSETTLTKYNTNANYGTVDNKTEIEIEDDGAYHISGGQLVIPTIAQLYELYRNTESEWVTDYEGSGINGRVMTSNINGNSIFLPANGEIIGVRAMYQTTDGYYWSKSLYTGNPRNAYRSTFSDLYYTPQFAENRCRGIGIRGVGVNNHLN